MSKKFVIISLIVIAIFGSLFTFYASNLFFSDIGGGFVNTTLFITLSALMLGAMVVAAPIFIVRFYQRKNSRKILSRNYLIIAICLGSLGLIFTILAGLIDMHSFIKPYPFPGYLIIMLVLFILIIAGSLITLFKFVLPMPKDQEIFKVTAKHVFYTIGIYLLIALTFNRFGAFLFMPIYVQWSTLYKTFIYYLFLLVPLALLIIKTCKILEIGNSHFISTLVVAIINICLFTAIVIIGKGDTTFISAVSAAAPLERLGSMPMEILIHFVAYLGVSIYYLVKEILKCKASKKEGAIN